MSRLSARVAVPALVILALAGCGSSSKSTSSQATSTATSTVVDPTIAAQVPTPIKAKGTLNVATEAQYAPNEFIAADGHTVIGMDADLMRAMGRLMGLNVKMIDSTFETIIPGLAAGRYDIGASSFTDTKEREKTVDFVDYFQAGISFYALRSTNSTANTIASLCGRTVALEKGTTEQEEAEKQSKKCAEEGKKPIDILSFPGQNPVNLAIASGRAELGMADSPVVAYQIAQSKGQFKLLCKCYGFAPYGIAVPKTSGMTAPILSALKKLMADGTYSAILTKWGIESGGIDNPKINGAIG